MVVCIFLLAITYMRFISLPFKASHFQNTTVTTVLFVTDFTSFPRTKCLRIKRKYKVRFVLRKTCQKKQSHQAETKQSPCQLHRECS